jgi:hypothetical protein
VPYPWVLVGRISAGRAPGKPALTTATGGRPPLLEGLGDLAPTERRRKLLGLVRQTAAAVLGHRDAEAVEADLGFMDGEFDSLTLVELRNKLASATGLRLSSAAVFDHPTPRSLAGHLDGLLVPATPPPPEPRPVGEAAHDAHDARDARDAQNADGDLEELAAASDEELFHLLDTEWGLT